MTRQQPPSSTQIRSPKPSQQRIYELDVLRGVAALGVVLYHYTTRYDQIYGHSAALLVTFPQGRFGVPLFFMISGFVILMTLEKTQRTLDFIVGRLVRLYPVYWVAIALTFTAVALWGLPGRDVELQQALFNLTMVQQWFRIPDVDGVYWTLYVELCFYGTMLLLHRFKLLRHMETVAIAWLLINLVRTQMGWPYLPKLLDQLLIPGYAHLFILGIVLYRMRKEGGTFVRYQLVVSCVLIHAMTNHWESVLYCMGSALALYLATQNHLRFIAIKPLIFLGTISYSLYLIHQNIGYIVIRSLSGGTVHPYVSMAIALSLSLGLASLMTFCVEHPAMTYLKTLYREKILTSPFVQPKPNRVYALIRRSR